MPLLRKPEISTWKVKAPISSLVIRVHHMENGRVETYCGSCNRSLTYDRHGCTRLDSREKKIRNMLARRGVSRLTVEQEKLDEHLALLLESLGLDPLNALLRGRETADAMRKQAVAWIVWWARECNPARTIPQAMSEQLARLQQAGVPLPSRLRRRGFSSVISERFTQWK